MIPVLKASIARDRWREAGRRGLRLETAERLRWSSSRAAWTICWQRTSLQAHCQRTRPSFCATRCAEIPALNSPEKMLRAWFTTFVSRPLTLMGEPRHHGQTGQAIRDQRCGATLRHVQQAQPPPRGRVGEGKMKRPSLKEPAMSTVDELPLASAKDAWPGTSTPC